MQRSYRNNDIGKQDLLEVLPPEILYRVLEYVDVNDLFVLRAVKHYLHKFVHTHENALLECFVKRLRCKYPDVHLLCDLPKSRSRGIVCMKEIQRQDRAAEKLARAIADRVVAWFQFHPADLESATAGAWLMKKRKAYTRSLYPSLIVLDQFCRILRTDVIDDQLYDLGGQQDDKHLYRLYQTCAVEKLKQLSASTLTTAIHAYGAFKHFSSTFWIYGFNTLLHEAGLSRQRILVLLGIQGIVDLLEDPNCPGTERDRTKRVNNDLDRWTGREPLRFEASEQGGISHLVWSQSRLSRSEIKAHPLLQPDFLDTQDLWVSAATEVLHSRFSARVPPPDHFVWQQDIYADVRSAYAQDIIADLNDYLNFESRLEQFSKQGIYYESGKSSTNINSIYPCSNHQLLRKET